MWPEAYGTVERFMGTRNKFVSVSVSDSRDWKAELPSFHMNYRATPHCATQISPFEAPTSGKMNIGLPNIPKSEPIPVPACMSQNDAVSKSKMEAYADKKRHTAPSPLTHVDQVLAE